MPAIIDRDPVVVAVLTGAAAPVLARLLRQRIEAVLPIGLGRLAALAERFQAAVRTRLPDLAARRRFLEAALTGAPRNSHWRTACRVPRRPSPTRSTTRTRRHPASCQAITLAILRLARQVGVELDATAPAGTPLPLGMPG